MILSAQQIRAARAMLDWSQEDLAKVASLSINTIYNLEKGHISPRKLTVVRTAFEDNGVEFVGTHGVNLQTEGHRCYAGRDSRDRFFDDLLAGILGNGYEIAAVFESNESFTKVFGGGEALNARRLEQLGERAKVRCILSDARHKDPLCSAFKFRAVPKQPLAPISFLLFGQSVALVVSDDVNFFFCVVTFSSFANRAWKSFELNWDAALPLI